MKWARMRYKVYKEFLGTRVSYMKDRRTDLGHSQESESHFRVSVKNKKKKNLPYRHLAAYFPVKITNMKNWIFLFNIFNKWTNDALLINEREENTKCEQMALGYLVCFSFYCSCKSQVKFRVQMIAFKYA